MFSIVVGVVVGILVFLCGYLAGWNNCHSKIKVGAPSTSTNKQSTQSSQRQWLPVGGGFNPNIDHPDIGYYVKR